MWNNPLVIDSEKLSQKFTLLKSSSSIQWVTVITSLCVLYKKPGTVLGANSNLCNPRFIFCIRLHWAFKGPQGPQTMCDLTIVNNCGFCSGQEILLKLWSQSVKYAAYHLTTAEYENQEDHVFATQWCTYRQAFRQICNVW